MPTSNSNTAITTKRKTNTSPTNTNTNNHYNPETATTGFALLDWLLSCPCLDRPISCYSCTDPFGVFGVKQDKQRRRQRERCIQQFQDYQRAVCQPYCLERNEKKKKKKKKRPSEAEDGYTRRFAPLPSQRSQRHRGGSVGATSSGSLRNRSRNMLDDDGEGAVHDGGECFNNRSNSNRCILFSNDYGDDDDITACSSSSDEDTTTRMAPIVYQGQGTTDDMRLTMDEYDMFFQVRRKSPSMNDMTKTNENNNPQQQQLDNSMLDQHPDDERSLTPTMGNDSNNNNKTKMPKPPSAVARTRRPRSPFASFFVPKQQQKQRGSNNKNRMAWLRNKDAKQASE